MANGGKLSKFQKEINSKLKRSLSQMMISGCSHRSKTASSNQSTR
jgi:hypothetical protein